MIPIRDSTRSATFPVVNIVIIIINALVFFYELSLGEALNRVINTFGLVPAHWIQVVQTNPFNIAGVVVPFFSSMFMHGGWMHFIGNMWFLWIFGDNVEDSMGHGRYIIFYLLCGVGAGVVHLITNIQSTVPTIGASGAIAGIMGAYMVLYPRGRVLTLIPIFIFFQFIEIPAVVFLLIWILIQTFQGVLTLGMAAGGGVAWWAHIGGFAIGAIFIFLFRKRRPIPPMYLG